MRTAAAAEKRGTARLVRLGAVAAFLGGLAWTLKGVVILAGGDQPPLLFETAPALFGMCLLSVAYSTMAQSRRRTAALGLAAAAAIVGLGLLTLERTRRWLAPLAWWIGVALVPALLIGGMLSQIDERLLEIPLICLGIAWMAVGWAGLHQPAVSTATR